MCDTTVTQLSSKKVTISPFSRLKGCCDACREPAECRDPRGLRPVSRLDQLAPICHLTRWACPSSSPCRCGRSGVPAVSGALFFPSWIFQGSRMIKDPQSPVPPKPTAPSETLEDAVYRSSLSAGNEAIKRGNPLATVPTTVAMYLLFGIVAFQLAKQSNVVKEKLK